MLCLQELKTTPEKRPDGRDRGCGYNVVIMARRAITASAILSRHPIEDVRTGLPGDDSDAHARYIEAVISRDGEAVRVALDLPAERQSDQ